MINLWLIIIYLCFIGYKGFARLQELVEDKKNEEEAEQVMCNWLCWNDKVGGPIDSRSQLLENYNLEGWKAWSVK